MSEAQDDGRSPLPTYSGPLDAVEMARVHSYEQDLKNRANESRRSHRFYMNRIWRNPNWNPDRSGWKPPSPTQWDMVTGELHNVVRDSGSSRSPGLAATVGRTPVCPNAGFPTERTRPMAPMPEAREVAEVTNACRCLLPLVRITPPGMTGTLMAAAARVQPASRTIGTPVEPNPEARADVPVLLIGCHRPLGDATGPRRRQGIGMSGANPPM